MAKHEYIVDFMNNDLPVQVRIFADYVELEEPFVQFCEEPDSSTGAGGVVFAVNSAFLVSVDRVGPVR